MVTSNLATLVRVKTMSDGSKRAEIDFGESVNLGDFDGLINKPLMVVVMTLEQYEQTQKQEALNNNKKIFSQP